MNDETRFLGYDQNENDFVVMDLLSFENGKVSIETGIAGADIEFSIWDLWKAIRRLKRCNRRTKRHVRKTDRKLRRRNR